MKLQKIAKTSITNAWECDRGHGRMQSSAVRTGIAHFLANLVGNLYAHKRKQSLKTHQTENKQI